MRKFCEDAQASTGTGDPESQPTLATSASSILDELRPTDARKAQPPLIRRLVHSEADYTLMEVLGKGAFATVYKARHRDAGDFFAVRVLEVNSERAAKDALTEIHSAAQLDGPHTTKLHGHWQDGHTYYMVMELCAGGTLRAAFDRHLDGLLHMDPGWNSGCETGVAVHWIVQMLLGLRFLHERGFIHRDIKLDNYLLEGASHTSPVKLADFGFTCRIAPGEKLKRRIGTAPYIAPEVLRKSYDQKADIWSLGVACFVLCTSHFPFEGHDGEAYLANVRAGGFVHREAAWTSHPADLRMVVIQLLQLDAHLRPTAAGALSDHAWLGCYYNDAAQDLYEAL